MDECVPLLIFKVLFGIYQSRLSLCCHARVCEENMAAALQVFTHRIQITVLLLGLNKRAPTPIG